MLLGNNLDFGKRQSLNQVIQNLSSAPGSPVEGLVYYDTTLKQFGCYQNTTWTYLATAGGGTVTSVSGTTNRITSTGGTTPVIDISATFEALLGKVAQRIDQNNAATTSAQLATTISDETGGAGVLVFNSSPTLNTPVLTGLPTGSGVASAATASTLAARDANANISADNFIEGYTTTVTAAGTTTLTVNDTFLQFFTGTTTQTVTLPVASTLVLGQQFLVVNNSTGVVTVNSSGANAVQVMAASSSALFTTILTSGTSAASWAVNYTPAFASTNTVNTAVLRDGSGNFSAGTITAALTGTASLATALATTRAIYGNNFDGTAALSQIIASTYGGTGNGFTKFSGPASSEKTFTLPNANETIATLGQANTWTGVQQFGTSGGAVGKFVLAGSTSGSTIVNAAAAAGSGTLTLPIGTDTLVGKATTDVFTNKTFDAAGTGNALSNIATSMFAANVIDTDTSLAANSDTRLATQKAVKAYADNIAQGLKWKQSVRVATTAAGTLASSFENADTIDGIALVTGDRILIKDQAAGAENGIYTVNASGAPTRATDADTATEIKDAVIPVEAGTANADKAFKVSNDGTITLGTTALTFIDFNLANVPAATTSTAGKVQLADVTAAEAKSSTTLAVTPASIANFPIKRTATIGDGSTTAIAVSDNLGTIDKMAICRDASTNAQILVDITYATNTTTFTFAVAPASNAYKVVIIG